MNEIEEKLAVANAKIRELESQLKINAFVEAGETLNATRWLQEKTIRQARALDRLNTRVLNQRFQLRTLNDLGRGLTTEEFLSAKADIENTQVAEKLTMATA